MSNIQIKDCHIYSKKQMRTYLTLRRKDTKSEVLLHRSDFSIINEWCFHSLLYRLGIAKERTRDCDLDWPQKWIFRTVYTVGGLIARIFTR